MLVSGAASSQDKLSQAAQSSAKTITQLTDVVKLGAASISSNDPETQVSWDHSSASYFFQIAPLSSQIWMLSGNLSRLTLHLGAAAIRSSLFL